MPEAAFPVQACVASVTWNPPRKELQGIDLIYVQRCCKVGFGARRWVPATIAMEVELVTNFPAAGLVHKPWQSFHSRVDSLATTVSWNHHLRVNSSRGCWRGGRLFRWCVGVEGAWVDDVGVNEARGVIAWTAPAL